MGLVKFVFYSLAFILLILMCAACLRRRKRSQGVIFTTVQAVPVTNQTVAVAPGTVYVAQQSHYPTQAPPILATVVAQHQVNVPMAMPQPYHPPPQMAMPMPQPYGQAPINTQFASPPPYNQIVREPYQQQSPFNPHFGGNQ